MTLIENLFDRRGGPGQEDICESCGEPVPDGQASPLCAGCLDLDEEDRA